MDQHDAQTLLARIKTALDRTAERLKASKATLARETESPADHEAAMLRLPPTDRGQD
jgi:hypothetical protein